MPTTKRRRSRLLLALLLAAGATATVVASVRLDWWEPVPQPAAEPIGFADGFEHAADLAALFPADGGRWHAAQRQPDSGVVELSPAIVRSGTTALKLYAPAYDGRTASKSDVVRGGLRFVKGDHVWSTAWYHLVGGTDATHLFLWDLEASDKYQSPGRRLYLQAGERLASDLGKWEFGGPTFRQPPGGGVAFPKDRWVRVRVHLFLSDGPDGLMEVWQDDVMVLNGSGQTLPTAKTVYDRLQVGITANGNRRDAQVLYVDDVRISNRPE
jgi:hypothetical protein